MLAPLNVVKSCILSVPINFSVVEILGIFWLVLQQAVIYYHLLSNLQQYARFVVKNPVSGQF